MSVLVCLPRFSLHCTEQPAPISAPSKVSVDEVKKRVQPLPLLDRRAFINVCTTMHSANGEETVAGRDFVRLVHLINDCNAGGQAPDREIKSGLFQAPYAVRPQKCSILGSCCEAGMFDPPGWWAAGVLASSSARSQQGHH